MPGDKGRVDFEEPYPCADVGQTGYQLQVQSAVPRGAGFNCLIVVWDGRLELTSDDVAITNPAGRTAFLEFVGTQIAGALDSPEKRLQWWAACEQVAANLQRAMQARQAEQRERSGSVHASQATRLVELAREPTCSTRPEAKPTPRSRSASTGRRGS